MRFIFQKAFFPKKSLWLLLLAALLLIGLFNYVDTFKKGPAGIHSWRQSDCFSIALNYYKENRPFLSPELHGCSPNGPYVTISEFPLLNYLAAKIWSVAGFHPGWYRLIHLCFWLLGMFSVFRISEGLLRNTWWGLLITLFFFSSPILGYYGFSFIADVPALCLSLFGTYLVYLYYRSAKKSRLLFAVPVFILAAFLKITALFLPAIIAGVLLLQQMKLIARAKAPLLKKPWLVIGGFAFIFCVVAGWYYYAAKFNSEHDAGLFLVGTLPIWELGYEQIINIGRSLIHTLLPAYFFRPALLLLLFLFVWIIFNRSKKTAVMMTLMCLSLLLVFAYLILFYQVFNVHDYYLTNMLPLVLVFVLSIAVYLRMNHRAMFQNRKAIVLFALLVAFQVWNATVEVRMRFSALDPLVTNSLFMNNADNEAYKYNRWATDALYSVCNKAEPWLRNKGITRDTRVVCFPDGSINIALAKMDQKGNTDNGYDHLTDRGKRLHAFTRYGAEYLIILDNNILNDSLIKPWTKHPVDSLQNLHLFDLKPYTDSLLKLPE
ncbi:MAG: hypothetical protein MUC87_02090 [Bacteroidia bacterium]|jgi:hypothetical protein|nr:hypothetical protein [Bacteroidia bacterium]